MPLLLWLGNWQLDRAEQKKQIETEVAAALAANPVPLDQVLAKKSPNYSQAAFTALLDNQHIWLLDNRIYQGQAGYEVLVMAQTNQQSVWVSLGWIVASPNRQILPTVQLPDTEVSLNGTLYRSAEDMLILQAEQLEQGWPKRIQRIDFELMQNNMDSEVAPWVVYLNNSNSVALQPIWEPTNMSSLTHTGYAVQWFAMATFLTLFYLYTCFKRMPDDHHRP